MSVEVSSPPVEMTESPSEQSVDGSFSTTIDGSTDKDFFKQVLPVTVLEQADVVLGSELSEPEFKRVSEKLLRENPMLRMITTTRVPGERVRVVALAEGSKDSSEIVLPPVIEMPRRPTPRPLTPPNNESTTTTEKNAEGVVTAGGLSLLVGKAVLKVADKLPPKLRRWAYKTTALTTVVATLASTATGCTPGPTTEVIPTQPKANAFELLTDTESVKNSPDDLRGEAIAQLPDSIMFSDPGSTVDGRSYVVNKSQIGITNERGQTVVFRFEDEGMEAALGDVAVEGMSEVLKFLMTRVNENQPWEVLPVVNSTLAPDGSGSTIYWVYQKNPDGVYEHVYDMQYTRGSGMILAEPDTLGVEGNNTNIVWGVGESDYTYDWVNQSSVSATPTAPVAEDPISTNEPEPTQVELTPEQLRQEQVLSIFNDNPFYMFGGDGELMEIGKENIGFEGDKSLTLKQDETNAGLIWMHDRNGKVVGRIELENPDFKGADVVYSMYTFEAIPGVPITFTSVVSPDYMTGLSVRNGTGQGRLLWRPADDNIEQEGLSYGAAYSKTVDAVNKDPSLWNLSASERMQYLAPYIFAALKYPKGSTLSQRTEMRNQMMDGDDIEPLANGADPNLGIEFVFLGGIVDTDNFKYFEVIDGRLRVNLLPWKFSNGTGDLDIGFPYVFSNPFNEESGNGLLSHEDFYLLNAMIKGFRDPNNQMSRYKVFEAFWIKE